MLLSRRWAKSIDIGVLKLWSYGTSRYEICHGWCHDTFSIPKFRTTSPVGAYRQMQEMLLSRYWYLIIMNSFSFAKMKTSSTNTVKDMCILAYATVHIDWHGIGRWHLVKYFHPPKRTEGETWAVNNVSWNLWTELQGYCQVHGAWRALTL